MPDGNLDGAGVLVTRPAAQCDELAEAIERRGGRAFRFPVLEIVGRPAAAIAEEAAALPTPDITIFVSRNAVAHGLTYADGSIAAIGPATAAAIREAGRDVDIVPDGGFDSEHLLRSAELAAPAGRNIRIVRGNAGRELLASELSGRGARVDYLPVYERRAARHEPATIDTLERRLAAGDVDAVVVMSVDTLDKLMALVPQHAHDALARTVLVTPAARVIKKVQAQYPRWRTLLAGGPQAEVVVETLVERLAARIDDAADGHS